MQFKLDNDEKRNILESHSSNNNLSKDEIDEIVKIDEYFPLLCHLYFSTKQKEGLRFFKEPVAVYKKEIKNFRDSCKEKYCALVLLVLFNNNVCIEDIRGNKPLEEKFKLALDLCEMEEKTTPFTIGKTLKTLKGFFVKKIGYSFQFCHDFVMEVTTFVLGTDHPQKTILYADIGFLRKRVKLESSNHKRDQFTICLSEKYIDDLGKRLFDDIFGERMLDVVLNPCMENERVASIFIDKFKHNPDKLMKLLEKKQLHIESQKLYQSKNQSVFSKLDFVYLKDEVSILSVIIVFCHTSLSVHCLEALQQTQTTNIDSSLFSAVCCNGSLDLFKVFPKDSVKEFLIETWGFLYPIHIVSMFHNHDILRELIQVNSDVNMLTDKEYKRTPIVQSVWKDTGENEQNDKKKNSIT